MENVTNRNFTYNIKIENQEQKQGIRKYQKSNKTMSNEV